LREPWVGLAENHVAEKIPKSRTTKSKPWKTPKRHRGTEKNGKHRKENTSGGQQGKRASEMDSPASQVRDKGLHTEWFAQKMRSKAARAQEKKFKWWGDGTRPRHQVRNEHVKIVQRTLGNSKNSEERKGKGTLQGTDSRQGAHAGGAMALSREAGGRSSAPFANRTKRGSERRSERDQGHVRNLHLRPDRKNLTKHLAAPVEPSRWRV